MHIDGNLIPLFAIAVGFIITITSIISQSITQYKLKVEQIKADALVRAEEVRTRNQLELEKLIRQEQNYSNNDNDIRKDESVSINTQNSSSKSRVRE